MSDTLDTTWRNTRTYNAEARRIAAAVAELPNAIMVPYLDHQFAEAPSIALAAARACSLTTEFTFLPQLPTSRCMPHTTVFVHAVATTGQKAMGTEVKMCRHLQHGLLN